jgi:hypothetical protein
MPGIGLAASDRSGNEGSEPSGAVTSVAYDAMGLFATGVSASVLLIAAHDRPFVGQIAVTPEPLLQIISDPVTKRRAEGPAWTPDQFFFVAPP